MEVAGLVLGVLPLVVEAMQVYSSLIKGTGSDKVELYSHRLREERARFETVIQLLSQHEPTHLPAGYDLMPPLIRRITDALNKASKIVLSMNDKSSMAKKLAWSLRDRERLGSIIEEISLYNSELISLATSGNMAPLDDKIRKHLSALDRLASDHLSTARPSTDRHLQRQKGHLLEGLVASCGSLFLLTTKENPVFTDVFNKFRLWELDVKSKSFYKALDVSTSTPPGSPHQDIVIILFRSVIRIIKVLIWSVQGSQQVKKSEWHQSIQTCTDSIRAACHEMPFLVDVNAEDLTKAKIMPGESTQAVLGTIELVVHTLQSCLPSTTRMSRQYSMQSEDMLASDVTRLLDISVDLIDPASKAFSYVAEQSTTKDLAGNAATVEFQSIRRVFDEQAAILRDWNAKHTQDIELKLANNSPAKLASIADSVQRIVTILSKLPSTMQSAVSVSHDEHELQASMKGFETFVQSLVALEPQLERTHAPPPYQSISKDRVILSVTGEILPAVV